MSGLLAIVCPMSRYRRSQQQARLSFGECSAGLCVSPHLDALAESGRGLVLTRSWRRRFVSMDLRRKLGRRQPPPPAIFPSPTRLTSFLVNLLDHVMAFKHHAHVVEISLIRDLLFH